MPELLRELERLLALLAELEAGANEVDAILARGGEAAVAASEATFAEGIRFACEAVRLDFLGQVGGQ